MKHRAAGGERRWAVRRRQQEYLEKSVEGLKRKLQTTTDVHRADTVRFRQARVLQPCYRCRSSVSAGHTYTLGHWYIAAPPGPGPRSMQQACRLLRLQPGSANTGRTQSNPIVPQGPARRWLTDSALFSKVL